MYNSLVERCFKDCVDSFRRKDLDATEEKVSSRAGNGWEGCSVGLLDVVALWTQAQRQGGAGGGECWGVLGRAVGGVRAAEFEAALFTSTLTHTCPLRCPAPAPPVRHCRPPCPQCVQSCCTKFMKHSARMGLRFGELSSEAESQMQQMMQQGGGK